MEEAPEIHASLVESVEQGKSLRMAMIDKKLRECADKQASGAEKLEVLEARKMDQVDAGLISTAFHERKALEKTCEKCRWR